MTSVDLRSLAVGKVVDARGTSCPGPILAAKKGIVGVASGAIMEVLATDAGTKKDLPAWSKKMGHEFLGVVEEDGYLRLFIKEVEVTVPATLGTAGPRFAPRILVLATNTISDPGIDLAGSAHMHYPPSVMTISLPCTSGIKPSWVLHAARQGFDGIFITADGDECAYLPDCTERASRIVTESQRLLREEGFASQRLRMAAICSVCAEPFVAYMDEFARVLAELGPVGDEAARSRKGAA